MSSHSVLYNIFTYPFILDFAKKEEEMEKPESELLINHFSHPHPLALVSFKPSSTPNRITCSAVPNKPRERVTHVIPAIIAYTNLALKCPNVLNMRQITIP